MEKIYKPIFQYSVMTPNRGDQAIRISIQRAIQKYIPEIPFAYFNCKGEILTEKRIPQFNQDASLLLLGGSGLYTNYPYDSGFYFPCKTELFEKIKIPIALIGIGCNNNLKNDIFKGDLSPKAKRSIKLINDLSVVSTVRDKRTYDILKSFGVKNHILNLDPANFLEVPVVKKEKKVAINIAQHAPALGRFDGGVEGEKNREKNISYFAEMCDYLDSKGYRIVFIAHDSLETSLIIDLKKKFKKLNWVNEDNTDKMLHEYATCEFSISMKMHSAIMSFASGTPAINVYYDQKSIEYLKMIKCEELGISVFDDYYKDLKSKVDILIKQYKYYTDKINKLKYIENIKFQEGIKELCNTIRISV